MVWRNVIYLGLDRVFKDSTLDIIYMYINKKIWDFNESFFLE